MSDPPGRTEIIRKAVRRIAWIWNPLPTDVLVSRLILCLAIAFNLYYLRSEIFVDVPKLNDGVLHLLTLGYVNGSLQPSSGFADPWMPPVGMGYPFLHYYQQLPYLPPALIHRLIPGSSLVDIFNRTSYLLLCFFPISVYWSMRRLGFSRVTSSIGGLLAPLIATDGLYGFDYNSYVWRGWGLYTQLWGMILLPMTIAQGYVTLKSGKGYAWTVLLLAATITCHLIYGYMAVWSLLLLAVLQPSPRELIVRGKRLALVLGLTALVTAYFVVPLWLDGAYNNHSVWELQEKFDSFGAGPILGKLFTGELLDFGRFPSMTILLALGAAACLWRIREERYRLPIALFVFWLVFYFGRPTWGPLLDLLPLGKDVPLHRLIGGVHLAAIYLMAIGLAFPWRWAVSKASHAEHTRRLLYLALPAVLTVAILYPVYQERAHYLDDNQALMQANHDSYARESTDIEDLFKTLKGLPPGRVYAGLPAQWGGQYKVGSIPMYALVTANNLDSLGRLYFPFSLNGDIQYLFDDTNQSEYNLFNVRYVIAPVGRTLPDFVRPVATFGRHRLYEVQTTGYFDFVDSNVAFTGQRNDFYPAAAAWLRSGLPQAKQHPAVYLEGSPPPGEPVHSLTAVPSVVTTLDSTAKATPGRLISQTISPDEYTAVVDMQRESYLLLKVTYHPSWHVTVDGQPADDVMLMPSYQGVKLAPGPHIIRFEYTVSPIRGYLLLVALLTILSLLLVHWRRRALFAWMEQKAPGRWPRRLFNNDVTETSERLASGSRMSAEFSAEHLGRVWKGVSALPERLSTMVLSNHVAALPRRLVHRIPFPRSTYGWAALFGLAIVIRLALSPLYAYLPNNSLDEFAWARWMKAIDEFGVLNVFRHANTDYVGYHWVLKLLSIVNGWIGGSYAEKPVVSGAWHPLDTRLHLLLKVPPLLFDMALAVAVYSATSALLSSRDATPGAPSDGASKQGVALAAAAGIAFHPAVIYESAVWAQVDASITAAMIGSVVLVSARRPGWGWALWGLGFLVKPQPFVILPILAVLTVNRSDWRGLGRGMACAAAVVALVLLPWVLHGDLSRIVDIYRIQFQSEQYADRLSQAAWNIWWFFDVGGHHLPGDSIVSFLPFLTFKLAGLTLSLGAALLAFIYVLRRPTLKDGLIASAFMAFALYMLPTGTHERYLYPFLGLLLPVAIVERKWLWLYVPASLTFFLNLLFVAPPVHAYSGRWDESPFSLLVASVNVCLFTGFAAVLARGIDWRALISAIEGCAYELWAAARARALAALSAETVSEARDRAAQTLAARTRPFPRLTARHLPFLTVLAVTIVLAGLPLLSLDALGGHDSLAYLPRNIEFWQGLKAGQVFPRWAPDLGAGYGEPTFNYNPPVFYYLSAFFHFLGFGFIASEDLAAFALLVLAGAGMYALAQSFFGRKGGLVSAVAYVFAPFVLSRLYVSHAMADYAAFAFIPWALWGLHEYVTGGRYRFLLLGAVSVALIFLSSSAVSLFTFPALALLAAALAWRERTRAAAIRGGWLLLLGIGLAAFFVLPALVETKFVHIERRQERIDWHDHFVYVWQFLYGAWSYGTSVPGSGDGLSFALGFAHWGAVVVALAVMGRLWRTARRTATVVAVALAVLLGALFFSSNLSQPLWEVLTPLYPLQFPWRFLELAAVSTAFLFGAPFLLLRARPRAAYGLMALVIGAVLLFSLPHAHPPDHLPLSEADYSPTNIAVNRIPATAREFEPIWVTQFPSATPTQKLEFVQGKANIVTSRVSPFNYSFGISVTSTALVRVNTFYFPGWQLYVDGVRREIQHSNPQGLMEFALTPGGHIVELRWGSTVARTWGWWLSALALLLLVATPWLGGRGLGLLRRARARVRRAWPAPADSAARRARRARRAGLFRGVRFFRGARTGKAGRPEGKGPGRWSAQTKGAIGIYLLLLALYLATSPGHFFSTEEVAVYETGKAIVEDGNLEIPAIQDGVPRNGKWYSIYEPGQAVASIPLYVVGSVTESVSSPAVESYLAGDQNYDVRRVFGGTVPIFFVSLFNQLVTPLLCVLIYLFCLKLGFSLRASFATAIVFGVGTLAWSQAAEYFQHPLEALFLLAAVYVLFSRRYTLRPRDVLLASALLACGVQTRFSLVVTVPLLFGYLAWIRLRAIEARSGAAAWPGSVVSRLRSLLAREGWSVPRGEWRYIALFAIPLVVALGLSFWLAYFRTGDWLAIHGGGRGVEAAGGFSPAYIPTGIASLLLSPGRSLFLYSPPVLAGAFAFRRFWKEHTDVAVLFLGIALAYLLLYSSFQYWQGGLSWGPRYLYPAFPFLIIPVAYLFEKRTWTVLVGLLTALGAAISLLAVSINPSLATQGQPPHNYHYLWTLDENPIVLHFKDFFAGRHFDLWLQYVLHDQGTGWFVATALFLALIAVAGLLVLRSAGIVPWPSGGGGVDREGETDAQI